MHKPSSIRSVGRYLGRISVRGLMALVLVLGCGLGWIARSASLQREAVAELRQAGARITYDGDRIGPSRPGTTPTKTGRINGSFWAPDWLVGRVGIDYFSHPVRVQMMRADKGPIETALPYLGRLDRLDTLVITSDGLTDEGLAYIGGLKSLWILQLRGGNFGDESLKLIGNMSKLKYLTLDGSRVTDAGLAHLAKLHDLESLILTGPEITDAGVSHLGGLTRLKYLNLCGTRMTNAGLLHLQNLPNLLTLRLDQNFDIDGVGIDALQQKLPKVKIIHAF